MKPAGHNWTTLGLLAVLLLAARPGAAQLVQKPQVPETPSILTDTTHLQLLHTPQGVRFVFRERGTGALPKPGSRIALRYTGFLPNGHIFDATEAWGGPLRFRVGHKEVITGLDEVVQQLPVGSRVQAWIPAALAYGAKGVRDPDDDSRFVIPPDTELVFELLILSVR